MNPEVLLARDITPQLIGIGIGLIVLVLCLIPIILYLKKLQNRVFEIEDMPFDERTTPDAEALKIILALKEENVLLKRAIVDALIMVSKRRTHFILKYDNKDVSWLFKEIQALLGELEEKQAPSTEESTANQEVLIAEKEKQYPGLNIRYLMSDEYRELEFDIYMRMCKAMRS